MIARRSNLQKDIIARKTWETRIKMIAQRRKFRIHTIEWWHEKTMSLLQWHEWVCYNDLSEFATMTRVSLLQWHEWVCYNDIYSESATMISTVSLLQWHLQWVCYNDIYSESVTMTQVSLLQWHIQHYLATLLRERRVRDETRDRWYINTTSR